jgi:nucleoside 2-deoxyribosyltransferase
MVGNTVGYCRQWREHATKYLASKGYTTLDPLRGLELKDTEVITAETEGDKYRQLFARDLSDVDNADIILAVFIGASTGTGFELGYAYSLNLFAEWDDNYVVERDKKQLVIVSDTKHPFLLACADYFTDNLDSALEYITKL